MLNLSNDDLLVLVAALEELKVAAGERGLGKYIGHKCDDLSQRLIQYGSDRRYSDAKP